MSADVSLVRRRLRHAIDAARRAGAERRTRTDAAERVYEQFLEGTAIPAFRVVAAALRGEGIGFDVLTPSGGVSLVSARQRSDVIELELDRTTDPPAPNILVTRVRGSRVVRSERPVREDAAMEDLTEDDVIEMLLEELRPWLA